MTTVSFFIENEHIVKVRAKGHSGYAESGGDIVCAAVSALVQTAYLAIKDLGCEIAYVRDDDKALFEFDTRDIPDKARHDAQVILRALCVGTEDLRSGYPQFIKTEFLNGR